MKGPLRAAAAGATPPPLYQGRLTQTLAGDTIMKFTRFTVPLVAALMLVGPMATPCAAPSDLPGVNQYQAKTESGWDV